MRRSRLIFSTAAVAAIGLAGVPTAYAWGAAGHEIVATIAQIYLHPTTLEAVCEILDPSSSPSSSPPCHLSRIASWADQVRRLPKYRYTAAHHYVGAVDDHPSQTCAFPGTKGWAGKRDGNVLGAVRNMTNLLVEYTDGGYDRETAEEAIKFLVHYVGDMHMPLHLTGRERGGNGVSVAFDGRHTNLHSLWDSGLLAQQLRTIPNNYTKPFPHGSTTVDVEKHLRGAIYDPYIRRVMYEGMGVGMADGRFEDGVFDWTVCPAPEPLSIWMSLQTTLGLRAPGDETRWDDDYVCPYAWANQLHKLNCEFPVWPAELDLPPYNENHATTHEHTNSSTSTSDASLTATMSDPHAHSHDDDYHEDPAYASSRPRSPHHELLELDTPEYNGRIKSEWLLERVLASAGVRLAGLLNGLFIELGDEEIENTSLPVVRPYMR